MDRPRSPRALRSSALVLALFSVVASAATCTDLQRPQLGACGNDIQEVGEDCDGNTVSADGTKFTCGALDQGTAKACHWLCTEGACPSGYQCDTLGEVCHQPSGTFAQTEPNLAIAASGVAAFTRVRSLAAAELDGVAPSELLVLGGDVVSSDRESLFVSFFDETARAREVRRERSELKQAVPLAVSRASKDGAVLFVAAEPDRPTVLPLRGQPDQSLLPGLAAQWGGLDTKAVLSPEGKITADGGNFRALLDGARSANPTGGLVGGPLPGFIVVSPHLFTVDYQLREGDEVIPRMSTAPLVAGGADVLALGVRKAPLDGEAQGETELRIYRPIVNQIDMIMDRIELPEGLRLAADGGVWLGTVDADPFGDLMFAAEDGNTYVAFGRQPDLNGAPSFEPVSPAPLILGTHPLAVGYIDRDARVDFVFPSNGIALSQADPSFISLCPTIQSDVAYVCIGIGSPFETPQWQSASIGDLNGDGAPDVVTAGVAPVLNVFMSYYASPTANPQLLANTIPTAGGPRNVALADLDLDFLLDVVFDVPGLTASAPESLYAVFATPGGWPGTPKKLLDAKRFLDVEGTPIGGVGILSQDGSDEVRWSVVDPRPNRELASPLVVPCLNGVTSTTPEDFRVPEQLAAGRYGGPDVDAVLLYQDCFGPENAPAADRLVLVPSTPNGGLGAVFHEPLDIDACPNRNVGSCQQARRAMTPTGIDLEVPTGWSTTALLLPVDLDRDGVDELVLIGPDGAGGGRVLVARPDGAERPRFAVSQDDPIAEALGGPYTELRGGLESADVDGDGFLDVVVLTTPADDAPRKLVVLLNDQHGGLRVVDAVRLDLGTHTGARAFALLDSDLDGLRDDVFLVERGAVWLGHLDVPTATVAYAEDPLADLSGLTHTRAIDHITAADFDGDNLTDFAVATDDGEVHVYRNVAENP